MKNYLLPGKKIEVIAGGDVASGSIQVVGALVGVASKKAISGEAYQLELEGIYKLPKAAGASSGWAQGVKLYAAAGLVTKTDNSGANPFIGYANKAQGDNDVIVEVLLARAGFTYVAP